MNIDFKLPELGENISSGDVVSVLVKEGDVIAANDGVVELETDKAVVEIPCLHAGRVAKLLVKKGDTVKVGQTLLTIASGETAAPAASPPAASAPAQKQGEAAKPAVAPSVKPANAQSSAPATVATQVLDRPGPIPAGPAVRRMAREHGVDLRTIAGSGKHGRITPEDLQASSPSVHAAVSQSAASQPAPSAAAPAPVAKTPAAPITSITVAADGAANDPWGPVRVEKLSRIRRTIAEQMVRSATTIPHVTNFDDADVTELERLRKGFHASQLGSGENSIKLTMMPFVMKAVALVLRNHATLNAVFDDQNDQIVYKEYVNLGVAVDTPRGLVVPNVRSADRLSIVQLAQALTSIAQRAKASQFNVDDLRGGTFTISNLGAVGGAYSTPIINYPEVAILLIGRARWMPVTRGENHDKIESRLMMPLSLSFDHRLVDGATAGRFLNEVIRNLEAPGMLLLA